MNRLRKGSATRCLHHRLYRLAVGVLCCLSVALFPVPVQAMDGEAALYSGVSWHAGGSLRMRYEWKQGFALGKPNAIDSQDYLLSQLRVHMQVKRGDRWSLYVEGQDARVLNGFLQNSINDRKTPNIFSDYFDLHQGYLDLHWGDAAASWLRLGRQKFNLGAQRLVASLEWVNTARVWDAARWHQQIGDHDRAFDLFASKLVPVRPRAFNTHAPSGNRMFDSQFHGIYFTDQASLPHTRTELYYLLRRNHRVGDRVHTLGARFDYRAAHWRADLEAVAQSGRYAFLQQQAYALHVGAGWQPGGGVDVGVAYNYGSGDRNSADGKHQTFDNLYPLNHAYYGYMDLFSLQNIHNVEAVLKWQWAGAKLRLVYEDFWLAQSVTDAWYNAGGGVVRRATQAVSSHVGREIDVTLAHHYQPWHLATLIGYSHFFAGAYIRQTGSSRDMNFFFLQSKYTY